MFTKRLVLFLSIIFLLVPSMASANQGTENEVSRGDFFQLVVNHLNLKPSDPSVTLPQDVSSESPLAEVVKVLKERGIVNGYPDGTFRLENKISSKEASYIIGRVLNIDEQKALTELEKGFNVSLGSEFLSNSNAKEAITSALTSDQSALELMKKSTIALNEQTSFRVNTVMTMEMLLDKKASEQMTGFSENMEMKSKMNMDFHREQGYHAEITTELPQGLEAELPNLAMEQYIVEDGIYVKIPAPAIGGSEWINMSDQYPFTFAQLIEMQEQSLSLNPQLNGKFLFYHDLGKETNDGKEFHKIAINGNLDSLNQIMNLLNQFGQNDMISEQLKQTTDMTMTFSGFIWIEEETSLPYKQTANYSISYGTNGTVTSPLAIDGLNMVIEMSYTDFNNVSNIKLPEEAKNAKKLDIPILESESIDIK